jgi:hypothetical protein
MSAIPTRVREVVDERDQKQCVRCANRAGEKHHRQRRREGGHGYWNVISLCGTCHRYVHAHPAQSRELGYIIGVHESDPESIPIRTFMGWMRLKADGDVVFIEDGIAEIVSSTCNDPAQDEE